MARLFPCFKHGQVDNVTVLSEALWASAPQQIAVYARSPSVVCTVVFPGFYPGTKIGKLLVRGDKEKSVIHWSLTSSGGY